MGQFSFVCDINVIFSLFFAIVIYTDVLHINPNKSKNSFRGFLFSYHTELFHGTKGGGGFNLVVIFITSLRAIGLYGHGNF